MSIPRSDFEDYISDKEGLGGLEAFATTLGRLLLEQGPFDVPMFQRAYRWRRKPNLNDFWSDWIAHAPPPFGDGRDVGNFLGSIVLSETDAAQRGRLAVLDGQQRLLTSSMALKALSLHALRLGMAHELAIAETLLRDDKGGPRITAARANIDDLQLALACDERPASIPRDRGDSADPEEEPGQISGQNASQDAESEDERDDIGDETIRLRAAMTFFYDRIEEALSDAPDPRTSLKDLMRTLLARVRIVVIKLGHSDDGLDIFDRHNTRAELLSMLDRVKIALMEAARRPGPGGARKNAEIVADIYDRLWAPVFDEPNRVDFWDEATLRFKERRLNQDWFLRAFLSALRAREVSGPRVLEETRRLISAANGAASAERAQALLQAICDAGQAFAEINGAPPLAKRQEQVERIRLFARYSAEPLLLALRVDHWRDDEAVEPILDMLESCVVRRFFKEEGSVGDYAFFSRLCSSVATDRGLRGARLAAAFREELANAGRKTAFWPSDRAFLQAFKTRKLADRSSTRSGRERKHLFRVVYTALDEVARGAAPPAPELEDDSVTIEHIFPINGHEGWPALGPRDHRWLSTIGNLALVDGSLNRAMGARLWSDKRHMIGEGSQIHLNQQLATDPSWIERWDLATIQDRGGQLARLAVLRWPGPTSPHWPGG